MVRARAINESDWFESQVKEYRRAEDFRADSESMADSGWSIASWADANAWNWPEIWMFRYLLLFHKPRPRFYVTYVRRLEGPQVESSLL
jgi:hypothetical protein